MLTGTALRNEATRLAIPGRSKMTADQLRAAIAAVTAPLPPNLGDMFAAMPPVWDAATRVACDPYGAPCDPSGGAFDPDSPYYKGLVFTPYAAPWTSRNGKHKRSATRRPGWSRRSI